MNTYNGWNNNSHKLDGIGGNKPFLNSKPNNMTREEILAKRIITFPEEGHMLDSDIKRNVYAAMSEFAQQEAIAFAEWCTRNGFEPCGINKWWEIYASAGDETEYTSEQLYSLFKKQNNG